MGDTRISWVERPMETPHNWLPFPAHAIVLAVTQEGGRVIGPVANFWWGFEDYDGYILPLVIMRARRLDKPLKPKSEAGSYLSTALHLLKNAERSEILRIQQNFGRWQKGNPRASDLEVVRNFYRIVYTCT